MRPESRAKPSPLRRLARFPFWMVGSAILSVAVLISAPFFGWQYSFPAVVIAIASLVLMAIGLFGWVSAGWVRKAIEQRRVAGATVWPIRVQSTGGRWVRVGMLEADEGGVTLTVDRRAVQATWADLVNVELVDGGILKGTSIVLDGPRSGRIEFEVLQPNAFVREGEQAARGCFAVLERLRSGEGVRQVRPSGS
jgi:hypothetical protein